MIIPVNLDEKYDVIVENGALDDVEKYFNLNRKVLVLTDDGVPEMYAEKVAKKCETPDRKSTRLNSSHNNQSRMPSSA